MTIYLGTTPLTSTSGQRNIGQIIQSTVPLTDAGLHLLDGSVISGNGSYSAFVTYIAGLVSSYPDLFTTEANWQTSVTNYGVCGKFVYDSVNNTVRLPKYSDKIWSGLGTVGVKGNGMTLGLTDGTNNTGLYANVSSSPYLIQNNNGAYGSNVGLTFAGGALGNSKSLGITLDSSKSGVIADLSTITTALEGYWYIVIATSTKTQIEVDIDEIATDLNGKADVDLSNMNPTQTVKNTIVGWGMPDYSAGVAKTWNTDITTTQDVRVCYGGASQNQVGDSIRLYINNNLVGNYIIASAGVFMQWVDIPAGVTYKVTGGQWGQYITEYPFLGE